MSDEATAFYAAGAIDTQHLDYPLHSDNLYAYTCVARKTTTCLLHAPCMAHQHRLCEHEPLSGGSIRATSNAGPKASVDGIQILYIRLYQASVGPLI